MTSKNVLLVGLHASAVDFDKWPTLTRQSLEAAFAEVDAALAREGFTVRWCLVKDAESAEQMLRDALADFRPDVISIGAGVRADPDRLSLFEHLVNACHTLAPQASFAFNTDPLDTIASVKRWA